MIFEELCRRKIDWICAIHSEKAYNKNSNCVQKSHTLEYKIVYDDLFETQLGDKTLKTIENLMAHVHSHFCHSSLGTKLQLKRVGEIKHLKGEKWLSTKPQYSKDKFAFPTFEDFANKERGEADVLVAIGNCSSYAGLLGMSVLDTVCQKPERSFNINFY